jgi:hypothetical protein
MQAYISTLIVFFTSHAEADNFFCHPHLAEAQPLPFAKPGENRANRLLSFWTILRTMNMLLHGPEIYSSLRYTPPCTRLIAADSVQPALSVYRMLLCDREAQISWLPLRCNLDTIEDDAVRTGDSKPAAMGGNWRTELCCVGLSAQRLNNEAKNGCN